MALGRQGAVQDALLIGWHEVPIAPGHVFYDRLNALLDAAGFDGEVEALCQAHYASGVGRPSVAPGRYFRMLFVGYFEGLESERGIAWRCAHSLSLRQFVKLGTGEAVPDQSPLSRTRARLPLELHAAVFALVLRLAAQRGLVKGRRIGADASTMEANAAMRSIVGATTARAGRRCSASWPGPAGSQRRTRISSARSIRPARASGSRTPTGSARPTPEARITRLKDWPPSPSTRSIWTTARSSRAAAEIRLLWLAVDDHLVLVLLAQPTNRSIHSGSAASAIITITPNDGALSTVC